MTRGVFFQLDDAGRFFLRLHTLIDLSKYDWYIDDVELNYFFFRSGKYSGEAFQAALDTVSTLSFARIRRYPAGIPADRIDQYADYVQSRCDFLLFFYDGGFYEIYAKEPGLLSKILDFCINSGFEDVDTITDASDERNVMHF